MVCLMTGSLFIISILNFSNIAKLDDQITIAINGNKLNVKNVLEQNKLQQKNLCEVNGLILKNEISKINLLLSDFEQKFINTIRNKYVEETGKKCINADEITIKLDNLLEVIERIYDYAAMNENTRVNDNYNYHSLVRGEVMTYFNTKINDIVDKCIPPTKFVKNK